MVKPKTKNILKKNPKGYSAIVIYEILRDEILSLELRPCQLIDEVSIANRFSVSRSPVREAMARLVSEFLLQTLPNKGTIVTPLRIEEFSQYIDALDLLQRAVTRLAAKFRTKASLQLLREEEVKFNQSILTNDVMKMILNNRNFHLAIAKAGNNSYFENIYRNLLDDGRRSLRLYFRSYDDDLSGGRVDNHGLMIDAIEAQDCDLAEHLAHEHTVEMQQRFLKYLGTQHSNDIKILS